MGLADPSRYVRESSAAMVKLEKGKLTEPHQKPVQLPRDLP